MSAPATTFADSSGSLGTVDSVTLYESSSDDYAMANGVVSVREKTGTKRDYKWGGSLCPGRNVSSDSIGMLFDALRSQPNVEIVPSYKVGNGATRCLTGFKLSFNRPEVGG
ncbi:hypothetical protein [Nannocystis bainbridge]|uniref:Uncharacterized protein n=1 Tax=Nannocystis bainbridge TaxID=2995303 RepID=A0ABT5E894_9BACT|nr:hypothetical protein [Nannocystis bainbridge]MDC0721860.1 hypothetical protein [Nannocystis bainbridge]